MSDRLVHDRREAMLGELLDVMRRHHRRRRRRRAAASFTLLLAAGAVAVVAYQTPQRPARGPAESNGAPSRPTVRVVTAADRTDRIRSIDDDELLHRLWEIDRPAGLIRVGDRAWVTGAVAGAGATGNSADQPLGRGPAL